MGPKKKQKTDTVSKGTAAQNKARIEQATASHPKTLEYFFSKQAAKPTVQLTHTDAPITGIIASQPSAQQALPKTTKQKDSDHGDADYTQPTSDDGMESDSDFEEVEEQADEEEPYEASQSAFGDESSAPSRQMSGATERLTTPKKVYGDKHLTMVAKLERRLKDPGVVKAQPSITTLYDKTIQAIVDAAKNQNTPKRYTVNRREKQSMHSAKFRHTHNKGDPFIEKVKHSRSGKMRYVIKFMHIRTKTVASTFSIQETDVGNVDLELPADLRRFAAALEAIINAWPYAAPGNRADGVKRAMTQAALSAIGGGQICINTPHVFKKDGLALDISFIHEGTGEYTSTRIESSKGFSAGKDFTIPAHVDFCFIDKKRQTHIVDKTVDNGKAVWASKVPEDVLTYPAYKATKIKPVLAAIRERERFFRFVAWRLTDIVSTPDKIHRLVNHMEVTYGTGFTGPRSKKLPQIPGFINVQDHAVPGYLYIRIPGDVCRKLKIDCENGFALAVRTTDGRWIARIIEVTTETLIRDFDQITALRALAQEIDNTHAALAADLPPPPACNCPPDMRDELTHPCTTCTVRFPCSQLFIGQAGVRRCLGCDPDAHIPFQDNIVPRVLARGARRALLKEFKAHDLKTDTAYFDKLLAEITQTILDRQEPMQNGQYIDEYLTQTVNYHVGYNPFVPTIEAVMPLGRREEDGRILRHTSDNVIVTGWGLNIWHNAYHIGVISEILKYVRGSRSSDDEAHLVSRVEDMMAVPIPFFLGRRSKEIPKLSQEQYELQRYEFLIGRPLKPVSQKEMDQKYRLMLSRQLQGSLSLPDCQWTDEQCEIIRKISLEIQQYYSSGAVTIQLADDGAVWPRQWGKMPQYWNWQVCYVWAYEHFLTWSNACNAAWKTEEDPLTIWLETIRQLHDTERQAKLTLKLPQRPWRKQMLSPSFGHMPGHHNVQMLTGWSHSPTSLEDWDSDRCSVILMAWADNLIDFCWKSQDIARVKSLYVEGDWQIPKQWYDPDATMPAHLRGKKLDHVEVEVLSGPDEDNVIIGLGTAGDGQTVVDMPELDDATDRFIRTGVQGTTASAALSPTLGWPFALAIDAVVNAYTAKGLQADQVNKRVDVPFGTMRLSLPSISDIKCLTPPASLSDGESAWMSTDMLMPAFHTVRANAAISTHVYLLDFESVQFYLGNVLEEDHDISAAIQIHIDNNQDLASKGTPSWPASDMPLSCTELHTVLNDHGNHYIHVAFVVDPALRSGRVLVRDSLPSSDQRRWLLNFAELFTKNESSPWYLFVFDDEVAMPSCPQQPNFYDCGLFALDSWRAAVTQTPVQSFANNTAATAHAVQLRCELLGCIFELATGRSFLELLQPTQQALLTSTSSSLLKSLGSLEPAHPAAEKGSTPESARPAITSPLLSKQVNLEPAVMVPTVAESAIVEPTVVEPATDLYDLCTVRLTELLTFQAAFLSAAVSTQAGDEEERIDLLVSGTQFAAAASRFLQQSTRDDISYDEASKKFGSSSNGASFDPVEGYNMLLVFAEQYGVTMDMPLPSWM